MPTTDHSDGAAAAAVRDPADRTTPPVRARVRLAVAATIVAVAAAVPADATADTPAAPEGGALSAAPAPPGTAPLVCVVDGGVRAVPAIGAQLVLSDVLTAVAGLLDPGDDHGTLVAESVLQTWPWARIASVRVLQGGSADGALVPRAVDRCVGLGAAVVNLSVVSTSAQPQAVVDQTRAAVLRARDAGVDVVVAAGNAGGPVLFPGSAAPDVAIVVDATDGATRCSFASTGPDVVVGATACPTWLPTFDGRGWAPQAGSSFAAPQVAAVLAAMRAYAPGLDAAARRGVLSGMPGRLLDPAEVLRRIGRADLLPTVAAGTTAGAEPGAGGSSG
ncbi:S8 family serine peptidase, partial [Patulibacter minatonensis]|uniref:S8 family serine peptidase n=1 Tax=Patulibacter minatonensis TaxID=298163 RepID=UPI00047AF967